MTVLGYAAQKAKGPLKEYSFERRKPRSSDVIIAIQHCGICHSDIHQVNDEWGGPTYPMVQGHEIVGIVKEIGRDLTRYEIGERVGVGCFVVLLILVANVRHDT